MVECKVLNLSVESVQRPKLGLGAPVGLALVEDLLRHLVLQNRGRLCLAENAVLAEAKEALKDVLRDRETNDELLPWEQRAVEDPRKALLANR